MTERRDPRGSARVLTMPLSAPLARPAARSLAQVSCHVSCQGLVSRVSCRGPLAGSGVSYRPHLGLTAAHATRQGLGRLLETRARAQPEPRHRLPVPAV